jgi:uncharacterized protein (DUF2236 family)
MNADEAWAERKRRGYKTLFEREMENPELRAGVDAEMAAIAQEVEARKFARLVAEEIVEIENPRPVLRQSKRFWPSFKSLTFSFRRMTRTGGKRRRR